MNFLAKYRNWLLAATLALTSGLLGVWLGNGSAPGHVIPPTEQKTGGMTAALQTTSKDIQGPAPVAVINNPQQSTNAAELTLPPIPAEMAAEIRKLSNRSFEGLVEEKHADGSVSMDLQGHFQSVTAAVRGPDGKLIIRHGEDFLANVQPDTTVKNDTKNY